MTCLLQNAIMQSALENADRRKLDRKPPSLPLYVNPISQNNSMQNLSNTLDIVTASTKNNANHLI